MQLNTYQLAVNEHFRRMAGNSAVISVAGSGKTTTALNAIECLPFSTTTLLGAFNVSIRDEFKSKGVERGLRNVTYANFNGFGWGLCLRNCKTAPEMDVDKTANIMEFVVYKPNRDDEDDMKRFYTWRSAIERIVSLLKALNIHTKMEAARRLPEIINHYNLETPDDEMFLTCALDTYWKSVKHQAHYDFDDQKFMPIHHDWPIPCFDQVVVDEFQDVSPCELELMMRAARGGQFCAIGDPDQTIYGFKGATPSIFPDFIEKTKAKELPLSICYRCPISVIREAQKIVPRIEWAPGAKQGVVDSLSDKDFYKRIKDKDFVLCRTTDELVAAQIELTRMGRNSKVRGRDFATGLEYIISKVTRDRHMVIAEFTTRLLDYQMARTEQLTRLRREKEIMTLEDRCKSIRALSEEASNVEGIFARMKTVFTDSPHDGIDLLTIHKSKGLQAKDVWILRPDLLPHPRSHDREWMLQEEKRLKYVAVTRAEESLFWVTK